MGSVSFLSLQLSLAQFAPASIHCLGCALDDLHSKQGGKEGGDSLRVRAIAKVLSLSKLRARGRAIDQ